MAPQVRLIGADGQHFGVISIKEALKLGEEHALDVVEVSPNAEPPVCRLMDYGKFKYQQNKKQQAAKKQQKVVQIKEIKLRPKTEEHDLQYKVKNAARFLEDGNKVKVSVSFIGRELTHKEIGEHILEKFIGLLGNSGVIEQPIKSEGRSMIVIFAPEKK